MMGFVALLMGACRFVLNFKNIFVQFFLSNRPASFPLAFVPLVKVTRPGTVYSSSQTNSVKEFSDIYRMDELNTIKEYVARHIHLCPEEEDFANLLQIVQML